jgi:glycine/D-amino acid oxidase-like deaminating enzyme
VRSRLRRGESLWLQVRKVEPVRAPALRGHHSADIAIIGGGITGCAVAHRLASAGMRVALLEAARIGRGSTAASTALLMQEPDADFGDLARRYGTSGARGIWQASRKAVQGLIRALRGLRGAPHVELCPSIYVTRREERVRALKQELHARHRAGVAGEWLTPERLRRAAGFTAAGGILTRGNAQVDPYGACMAFARAAQRAGARLHEHSRARTIRQRDGGVEIDTGRARISALWVVVATGYATSEFRPLAGRFRLSDTYVVATPPLDRTARAAIGLRDVMLWDTERPYHYARWTPDRRFIFGGHDRPHRRKTARATFDRRIAALMEERHELFPAGRGIDCEYAWEGLFATTPDGLPYIGPHRRYPRHLFALGYGGNGMTFGFLAAQIITRMVCGTAERTDSLFRFGRLR